MNRVFHKAENMLFPTFLIPYSDFWSTMNRHAKIRPFQARLRL